MQAAIGSGGRWRKQREKEKRPVSNPVLGTIRTMQHKARLWALGSSYLAVLVLASALVFAGVLLDHLFVLPREGRAAFLVVFSVTAVVALCAATLLPLTRRLSDLYVAREIERHVPELKNSLISYVQCRTDPRVPREAKRLLVRRVGGSLAALDPHLVSHPKRALTLMWCALAIVVLLGLYAAFSPKSVLVSARRLFMPHARILPPTATRIVDVRPGDGWVAQGTAVQVRALVEGARPQSVYVVWGDSRAAGQRIFLSDKGGRQWVGRFPAALQDIAYHVEAGDTRSENFRITVVPKCVVLKVRTSLVPPSYSGLPPSTVEEGAIDGVRRWSAHLDDTRPEAQPAQGTVSRDRIRLLQGTLPERGVSRRLVFSEFVSCYVRGQVPQRRGSGCGCPGSRRRPEGACRCGCAPQVQGAG